MHAVASAYGRTPSSYLGIADPLRAYVFDKCCLLAWNNRPKERKRHSLHKDL